MIYVIIMISFEILIILLQQTYEKYVVVLKKELFLFINFQR